MGNTNKSNGRIFSLDLIRIVAILAVVMIHVSAGFINTESSKSWEFVFGNIFDSLSRIGVPLFVMVSGSLMLNESKEITLTQILRKNVLNIAALLVFWSAFYAVVYQIIIPLSNDSPISIKDFIYAFVFGHVHLWYLYMIIGLYLITPVLRSFVKKENSKIVLYFIILSCLVQFFVPLINILYHRISKVSLLLDFIDKFDLSFVCGYVTYYLLGWYIINVGFDKRFKKWLYAAGVFSALFTIVSTQLFPAQYLNTYSNMNIFILIYSVALFDFLHSYYKKNEKFEKILKQLSPLAFGVYAIHIAIISLFGYIFPYNGTHIVYILIKWVVVTILSFGVTFLLSKIPVLKKLVRG